MNSPDLFNRRIGKFSISRNLILKSPDTVFGIMETVIPVKVELAWESDSVEYTALSHSFNVVPEGYIPYKYQVVLENNRFVGWKRIDG